MNFERHIDPKEALGLGIKEELGYNISNISNEGVILPGINSEDIYIIMHAGSNSVSGFCSGKKLMKVILSLMKKSFSGYYAKWIWNTRNTSGGSLGYYYSSDGEFWTDACNTLGYYFQKMDNNKIMEL
jgi:hypothetical protein